MQAAAKSKGGLTESILKADPDKRSSPRGGFEYAGDKRKNESIYIQVGTGVHLMAGYSNQRFQTFRFSVLLNDNCLWLGIANLLISVLICSLNC